MLKHLNSPTWWSISSLFPLNSFMWLTVSSTFSWGYYWNSFVLVEASLLVQEFCFTSASKTCQRQIRTRNSNLCFKGLNSSEKYFYLHPPQKKRVSSQDDEPQHTTVQLLENSRRSCEMWEEQVGIMPANPNKTPEGFRVAAGAPLEWERVFIWPWLVHIHIHTLHIKPPCKHTCI